MCPQTGTPSAEVIAQGHRPWRGRTMKLGVAGIDSLPGSWSYLGHDHGPGLPEGPGPPRSVPRAGPSTVSPQQILTELLLCAGHTAIMEATESCPHGHYHLEEYKAPSPPLRVPSLPIPHGGTPSQDTVSQDTASEKPRWSAPATSCPPGLPLVQDPILQKEKVGSAAHKGGQLSGAAS